MAAITDLLNQVEDKTLRERLLAEAARLTKQKKFGLVFEDHLPQMYSALWHSCQKRQHRCQEVRAVTDTYRVVSIDGDQHPASKH
jgi:adenine-specific DNA-methyltransferase